MERFHACIHVYVCVLKINMCDTYIHASIHTQLTANGAISCMHTCICMCIKYLNMCGTYMHTQLTANGAIPAICRTLASPSIPVARTSAWALCNFVRRPDPQLQLQQAFAANAGD